MPPPPELSVEKRCAALANALALDEAARLHFTPVYTRYQEEMEQLLRSHFGPRPTPEEGAKMMRKKLSDKEIEEMIRKRFVVSRAILDVREKYFNEFLQFMTPRQIQQLYSLEKRGAEQMHMEHQRRRPGAPTGWPDDHSR